MGQELRGNLAGQFLLGISCEVAVKVSAGAASSESLTGVEGSTSKGSQLEGGLCFSPHNLPPGFECFHDTEAVVSQERAKQKVQCFLYSILLLIQVSPIQYRKKTTLGA